MNDKIHIPLQRSHPIDAPRILRLSILLFLVLLHTPRLTEAQNTAPDDTPYTLAVNESLTREMTGNQRHRYRLSLLAEQYAHVVVDQKGIDVELNLLNENGQSVARRDSPNGKFGPEAVSVIAQSPQTYLLEVIADRSQPAGSYRIMVAGPRAVSANDRTRIEAEQIVKNALNPPQPITPTSAIEQLEKARRLFSNIADAREEGYTLSNIGGSYLQQRKFEEAMHAYTQARSRLEAAPDLSGQAYVLNQMGAAHRDLDDPRKALGYYAQAITLRTQIGDRWGVAQIHNNIGVVYSRIGEQQAALKSFDLALPVWRELDQRDWEARTLNNVAKANVEMGNLLDSHKAYTQLLADCAAPCGLEPFFRNNLGIIHDTWGEPTEALTHYYRARQLFQDAKNKAEEARVLDNIGMVFAINGDPIAALEYFNQALQLRENELKHAEEEITRSNLGYAYLLLKNYSEARKHLELARQFNLRSNNQRFEAFTLMRLGDVNRAASQLQEALANYNEALRIQTKAEDRRGQAITLDRIAELYLLLNQPAQALENYDQALSRWSYVGDQQGEALSLYGIAQVHRKQGKLLEARDKIAAAIEKVESVRTRTTSHRLRMSYFSTKRDFYELEIDVRMSLYNQSRSQADLEAALLASERAHARNLLDVLAESHADIRQGVDPKLLELERTQRAQLTDKQSQFQTLLNKPHTAAQKGAVEKEIQALTRLFDHTQAEIRKGSPHYAALTQPQPLKLRQIQLLIDANTVLLEYAVGEERSYLWAVTQTDIKAFTLPGRATLEKATAAFREAVTAWEQPKSSTDVQKELAKLRAAYPNYRRHARELSNIVLQPAASLIANKRLVIVADGTLQYVSFAALAEPAAGRASSTPAPLVAKHEIIYQPSASVLGLIRATPHPNPEKTLAVFADPVFDKTDKRVQTGTNGSTVASITEVLSSETKRALRDVGDIGGVDGPLRLDRLDYSRGEANDIVAIAPPGSSMTALDFNASRSNFLKQDLKQYAMVHLATHGILNGQNPELSGLVFSLVDEHGNPEDGFLRLSDIYNLNLPVKMVVLSACRTGVGAQVKGEGLIGLTRGFMHAGAERVVASLWKVDDAATAALMKSFYGYMLKQNLPAAEALRRAQLDQMKIRREPFYWAGFVLQGEWK